VNKVLESKIVTFLYHEVTDDPKSSGFQRTSALPYKHGIKEFNENLEIISQSGINPNLIYDLSGTDTKGMLLTFDDGGKSSMYIADELEKRGWRGHFFITSSVIGDDTFLNKPEIVELHNRGHVIGAHSHTHPRMFYNLSFEEMYKEWKVNIDILQQIIGTTIDTASVPGGHMNLDAQLSAHKAGIKFLFTSEPVLRPWGINDMVCLGRVSPKTGTSLNKVRAYSQFRGFTRAIMIRRLKNTIKKVYYPLLNALER